MNRYNHRRLIKKFMFGYRQSKDFPLKLEEVFMEATDFVNTFSSSKRHPDDWSKKLEKKWRDKNESQIVDFWEDVLEGSMSQDDYYFYHFFYDIKCEEGKVVIDRHERNNYNFIDNNNYHKPSDRKYFYTFINDFFPGDNRQDYLVGKTWGQESANRSDSVAFLHAMGCPNEDSNKSLKVFKKHLEKCFSEYLFLKDEYEALFMLGIAMHGIIDSFTPSHMGFQHYAEQDKAMHAQGDVIPIRCNPIKLDKEKRVFGQIYETLYYDYDEEKIYFSPGQYHAEESVNGKMAAHNKGYNGGIDTIGEYIMFRIFLYIGKIRNTKTGELIADKEKVEKKWKSFEGIFDLQNKINEWLLDFEYSEEAYCYGESALKVMTDVYDFLSCKRNECKNNYQKYKDVKKTIKMAVDLWEIEYNKIRNIRDEHLALHLYDNETVEDILSEYNKRGYPYPLGLYSAPNRL